MSFLAGFLGGVAEGRERKESRELQKTQLGIQKTKLGMEREKLDMMREDRAAARAQSQKRAELKQQASEAFRESGTKGMVDFWLQHDPKMGADLAKSLGSYEKNLAETTGIKQENLKEIHGVVGGLGTVLEELPKDQAKKVYAQNLDKLRQFDSSFPKEYNEEARNRFIASIGLSIPAAERYALETDRRKALTEHGKMQAEIKDLMKGMQKAPSETKAKQLEVLDKAMKEKELEIDKKELEYTIKDLEVKNKKWDIVNEIQDEFVKQNKPYLEAQESYAQMQAIREQFEAGDYQGGPGALDVAIIMSTARIFEPGGRLSDEDTNRYANTQAWGPLFKKYYEKAIVDGRRLSDEERENLFGISDSIMKGKTQLFEERKNIFAEQAARHNVDPKDVFIISPMQKKQIKEKEGALFNQTLQGLSEIHPEITPEVLQENINEVMKINPGITRSKALKYIQKKIQEKSQGAAQ